MAVNQKIILEENKQAILMAMSIDSKPNEEQLKILKKFKGWGGLKCLLYPVNIEWNTLVNISKVDLAMEQDVKSFYHFIETQFSNNKEIIDNIKGAILTSFYTPEEIPETIFEKLYENNKEIHSFLDPSAGTGVYIEKFLKYFPHCEKVVAIEKDPITAIILSAIFKGEKNVKVYNKGFEEVSFNEKFDVIASNIPFGKTKVIYPKYDNEVTNKIHNFFFYRAQELLNEGGFLSFITSSGVFNSKENQFIREKLSEQGEVQVLITLPNNTFEQAGTQVTTHLFNYIKDKNRADDIISNVIEENGITINRYIYKYFDNSFLETPQINTNPYGDKEFSYKMTLQDCINEINKRIFVPHLNIENSLIIKDEELSFINYPSLLLQDITTKQEELKFIQRELPSEIQNFRVVGAIKGYYKGVSRPFAVVSKNNEDYLLELFVKGNVFKTKIDGFVNKKTFQENFINFLDEISELFGKNQIKIDLDFVKTPEGKNFAKYVTKVYKKPLLTNFYITEEEINLEYHREIQKDDICFSENRNPAVVKEIGDFESGKTYYQIEELKVTPQENAYLRSFFGVYHYLNVLTKAIDFVSKEETKKGSLKEEERLLIKQSINEKVEELNKRYDNFVKLYGYFNEQKNTRFQKQLDKYFPILKALENLSGQQKDLFSFYYEKSDIFRYEYTFSEERKISVKESLIRSLRDKREININYISQLSGKDYEEILSEWGNLVVFNPLSNNYELRDTFLSGDLYEKIEQLDKFSQTEEKEKAIQLLKEALPEKVPYFSIRKQLGSRWLPKEIVNDFINDFYDSDFRIFSNKKTDSFFIEVRGKGKQYFEYKTEGRRYIRTEDIIKNAYDNIYPIITYTIEHSDGTKETRTDEEATNFCKREISRLQKAFENYMLNLPQEKQAQLEEKYNRMFNNTTNLTFEEDLLDLSDMDLKNMDIPQIYPHQREAIWKILKNNGGIVDHEVGLGKTLTMIGLSQNLKNMGVCKKPMIIGLKANIGEIAQTYKKLYPKAKILFATEMDYKKGNREVFLNRVRMNDWDCVIMSHQQFENIPQNMEVELEIAQKELESLEENLMEIKGAEISKKQLVQLEISKKSLLASIERFQEKIKAHKKEDVMEFRQLGIDHIIVDESHYFKNLKFQTRHKRVAGLGNPEGSQMASNLLTAIRTIQLNTPNREGGASFFSGTPISNSLTELFLLHKYLTPVQLEKRNCTNFDSWASTFAIKSIDFEVNMVNQITPKERFRFFVNLPELAKMYTDLASVKFGGNMVDRPEKKEYLLESEQTPLQKRFYHKLAKFLQTKNPTNLNLEKPINIDSKNQALSIIAMNLAFKASLDMRLINSAYPDDSNSKINILVRDLISKYHNFNEQKGTQIVFCDISVSKRKLSFEEMDENYKNNVFTSIYDDIKYKLIFSGIPEKEIAFIQDYDTAKKKATLSEKMNKGEIRFLLGSTQNAGTGLNVQERLIRIAHLSIPWKPSEIIQRNGRGYRKGNWIAKEYNDNKVDISFSGTANTLDNYKMNINSIKEKFINQIRTASNSNVREMDEGEMDENAGMNLAEFQAQLSGDTTLLEKYKIEKKIKELETEKTFVISQKSINENKIREYQKRDKELDIIIDIIQQDFDKYQSNLKYDNKGVRINEPEYIGLNLDKESSKETLSEEVSNFLKQKWEEVSKMQEGIPVLVGKLCGFELYMENGYWETKAYARNPDNPKKSYSSRSGEINFKSENTAKNYYINCLSDIERQLKSNQKNKSENLDVLFKEQARVLPKWEKEEVLLELYDKKEYLERKIKSNLDTQETLPKEKKIIDGKSYYFPIVKDLSTLENALLKDLMGEQEKINAIFTSPEVIDVLEKLEKTETIQIYTQYFDEDKGREYVKFKINDGDMLYIHFCNLMNKNQDIDKEHIKSNQLKR